MIFLNLLSIEKFIGIGYENIHEYYYRADTEPHKTEMVETFKLTFPCNFAFETYPFDKQDCDLSFIDKLYESDHVVLNTPTALFYKNQHSTFKNNSLLMLTLPKVPSINYVDRILRIFDHFPFSLTTYFVNDISVLCSYKQINRTFYACKVKVHRPLYSGQSLSKIIPAFKMHILKVILHTYVHIYC